MDMSQEILMPGTDQMVAGNGKLASGRICRLDIFSPVVDHQLDNLFPLLFEDVKILFGVSQPVS